MFGYDEVLVAVEALPQWRCVKDAAQSYKGHGVALHLGEVWENPRTGRFGSYDFAEKWGGVTIVTITPHDSLIIIGQRKPVADPQPIIGFPSGLVQPGPMSRDILATALEEVVTETGYKVDWIEHCTSLPIRFAPMKVRTSSDFYVAWLKGIPGDQELEKGESEILVMDVSIATARALALSGHLNGDSIVALCLAHIGGYLKLC